MNMKLIVNFLPSAANINPVDHGLEWPEGAPLPSTTNILECLFRLEGVESASRGDGWFMVDSNRHNHRDAAVHEALCTLESFGFVSDRLKKLRAPKAA